MDFDVRTIIMLSALITLLVGAGLLIAARAFPTDTRGSLLRWALGVCAQSLGWCLLGLRNEISDAWSIVVANALIALGYAWCVQALRQFAGSPGRLRLSPYWLVGAALAIALTFTYAVPDLPTRVASVSAVYLSMFALCVSAVYATAPAPRPISHRLMLGVCWYAIAVLALRMIGEGFAHEPLRDPFAMTPIQVLVFSTGAFGPVLGTLAFVLMASDRVSARLHRLAMVDPLTETYNRRSLGDFAERAIAEAKRHGRGVAMLVVDADHFKRINDTWGHEAGDEALLALVRVLGASMRTEDLLGRLGGEEFAVLMPDANEAAGVAGAERLRAAVERATFRVGKHTVPLRISVGVAALADGDDFNALIRRADRAMYEAKHRGRNRVVAGSALAADAAVISA